MNLTGVPFFILARLSSAIYRSPDFACLSLHAISHPCGSRTSQVTPLGVILDPQGNSAELVKVQASLSPCKNLKGGEKYECNDTANIQRIYSRFETDGIQKIHTGS